MAEVQPGRFIAPSQLPVAGTFEPNDFLLGLTGTPLNSRRIRLESLLAFLEAKIVEVAVAQAVGQAIALLSGNGSQAMSIASISTDGDLPMGGGENVLQIAVLLGGTVFTLPEATAECFCIFLNLTGGTVTIAGQSVQANAIALLVRAESMTNAKIGVISTGGWADV